MLLVSLARGCNAQPKSEEPQGVSSVKGVLLWSDLTFQPWTTLAAVEANADVR